MHCSGDIRERTASATEATALEPNRPIDRELKGGQTDVYKFRLASGEFLHLVVEQNGVDVEVNLLKPDGKSMVDIDGPSGRFGPEEIAVITDISGDYRVQVISPNKTAPAGRYKYRLKPCGRRRRISEPHALRLKPLSLK